MRSWRMGGVVLGIALTAGAVTPSAVGAVSTTVVISQVYSRNGANGYNSQFIELHNRSSSTVDMDGWSVQFGGATDSPGTPYEAMTPLNSVTIAAGGYFLIAEAGGGSVGQTLPTPDVTGSMSLFYSQGKIALRTNQTPCQSGSCTADSATLDFVGYGGANESEGPQPAPGPADSAQADVRAAAGEQDTDVNHTDFALATVAPRNSASTPVDKVAPTATVKALAAFQTSTAFSPTWSASDPSGISQFESRARQATTSMGFSSYSSWYTGTATSTKYTGSMGQTVCISTRATDGANNVGPFSGDKCTAIPLDDRALTATSSFSRQTGSAYYRATYSFSHVAGATLKSKTITAKTLALIATTCASCGSVKVKWNNVSIGTFSLHSAATLHKVVIPLTTFSTAQAGQLQIVSTSSARVEIDGLGASRK